MNKVAKTNKKTLKSKIKTILAAPDKIICPDLDDEQFQRLKSMLLEGLDKNMEKPLVFAKQQNIKLGLQSTLRTIKQNKMKFILLSQQLKPRFVLGLIYRNAQVVDSTVPVYVHAGLEELCESVFGVRALALVICKSTEQLNNDMTERLEEWVRQNTFVPKTNPIQVTELMPKVKIPKKSLLHEVNPLPVITKAVPDKIEKINKSTTLQFISFDSKQDCAEEVPVDSQNEEECLTQALQKLSSKAKLQSENIYQPWTALKVAPNPNKIRKTKIKRK